jgi:hypothetical protein
MSVDTTITRNATLEDLAQILKDEHARKLDIVAPAAQIRARQGNIVIQGTEPVLTPDGVSRADGIYTPTAVFDEGISDKLAIPTAYLRRMRAEAPDLWDANVNGWLHGRTKVSDGTRQVLRKGDQRAFMLRLFRADSGGTGVARAFVSDRFARMENLDILLAALSGIRATGTGAQVIGADLTDRRMMVRVAAPEIAVHAPELLRNYRSPFTGARGADNPIVFAGFEISNSEVGGGAFTITPRIVVEVCRNGMTITKDALRAVHLGGKLEQGPISWSHETQAKAAELVTAKTRDAVSTFLDAGYMRRVIDGMTETAQTPIAQPEKVITELSKTLKFDPVTSEGILNHFIRGGDLSAGGVMHAITSHAQTVKDAQAASTLEANAIKAMELAAAATA